MVGPVSAGEILPAEQDSAVLDGIEVRKGTVGAFVRNARALDAMADDDPARDATIAQLCELLPKLRAVGVLDVFTPRSARLAEILQLDTGRGELSGERTW